MPQVKQSVDVVGGRCDVANVMTEGGKMVMMMTPVPGAVFGRGKTLVR